MFFLYLKRSKVIGDFRATLKAGMTERRKNTQNPKRWNHGMPEQWKGGKSPKIPQDRITERWNCGKSPEILKDGMIENHSKSEKAGL